MRESSMRLKLLAKRALLGKYGVAIGGILLLYAAMFVVVFVMEIVMMVLMMGAMVSMGPAASAVTVTCLMVVMMVVAIALEYLFIPGYMKLYLNICEGKPYKLGDLLYGLKHKPFKFILVGVLLTGISLLIMIPFMILMFVALLSGSMAFYIVTVILTSLGGTALALFVLIRYTLVLYLLVDDPEKTIRGCMKESGVMMMGHKKRYVYMVFSFIGWLFLTYSSFGILLLWLIPYASTTFTFFYLELRGDKLIEEKSAEYLDVERVEVDLS